jgi:hypothetical protein
MTTPNDDVPTAAELRHNMREELKFLRASIEALIAERDAAVARHELELAARDMIHAMGERRATAAIVADLTGLRKDAGDAKQGVAFWLEKLITRYERGDHITEAKP